MSKAMNKQVDLSMFAKSMFNRFQNLLAGTLSNEEKLTGIINKLEVSVQKKRVLAREVGAQMRAIADPDTSTLEPLERLQARREKLVRLGGTLVNKQRKNSQLSQIGQEIKALDAQIEAQQKTYDMLQESYGLARDTYRQAFNSLETVRINGPAMLKAIEAHKQAVAMRDQAAEQEDIDISFLTDLTSELETAQAELRSDKELDDDLDATNAFNVDAELAKMDADDINDDLMAEFQAAATN